MKQYLWGAFAGLVFVAVIISVYPNIFYLSSP